MFAPSLVWITSSLHSKKTITENSDQCVVAYMLSVSYSTHIKPEAHFLSFLTVEAPTAFSH